MLQFVREIPIRITLQGTPSSRRGFLFHLAAGFASADGSVDPLSGMSVNLLLVDRWLAELKSGLEQAVFVSKNESLNHALAEVMAVARLKLTECAEVAGATLQSLSFREERGWSFQWNASQSPQEQRFTYGQYFEMVPKSSSSELVRVEIRWHRMFDCEGDYQHEGFRLLKGLSLITQEELLQQLGRLVGYRLSSGSSVESITVNLLSRDIRLSLEGSPS